MGWRWRKSFGRGPLRINLSKRGIGWSLGIPGLRVGRSPSGRKYVSQSIPGTGLYWTKYFGGGRQQTGTQPGAPGVAGPVPHVPGSVPGAPPQPQLPPPTPAQNPAHPFRGQGPAGSSPRANAGGVVGAVTRFFDRLF